MRKIALSALASIPLLSLVGCEEPRNSEKVMVTSGDGKSSYSPPSRANDEKSRSGDDENRSSDDRSTSSEDKSKSSDDKNAALKEELRKSIKANLDATDAAIARLQEHEKTATGDAKKDIDKEIDSLKSKRDDLQKHSDKIETTGPTAWDQFKNDVSKAADALNAATKKALEKIK